MLGVSFSLTERIIINPVLYMRAESLNDPESLNRNGKKIWHFLEGEIFARITALFTSIFASADALIHLSTGCYKGAYLLLGKCCAIQASWNKSEVYEHFRRSAFFSVLAVVGSVTGTAWPESCRYFKQSPSDPFNGADLSSALPGTVLNLTKAVQNKEEKPPFVQLQNFWQQSTLSGREWFVKAFNQNHEGFKAVRNELAAMVYRPIVPLKERRVRWVTESEVLDTVWDRTNTISKGFFFHATSEKALESILKAKKIEVRHEKAYRGAFVSTQPELDFGRCVLVFNRNIERLNALEHGFTINQNTYWAGFSKDIPVSEHTLAYVMLDSRSDEERKTLQAQCKHWTGREIQVFLEGAVRQKLEDIARLEMGIPNEWPEEGQQAGLKMLNAMKLVLKVPQRLAIGQESGHEDQRKQMQMMSGY